MSALRRLLGTSGALRNRVIGVIGVINLVVLLDIFRMFRTVDFGLIGIAIIAIFLASWGISTLIYRWKRYDDLPVDIV